jgi:hypothetical protein
VNRVNAIKGTEVVAAAVGRWSPADVAFIRELHFIADAEGPDGRPVSEVVLRLLLQPRPPQFGGWPDPHGRFWEAEVLFRGVREFAVTQQGTGDIQVQGFDIEDLSGSQLEGIRLRVLDYEFNRISFWATSGIVLSCREATAPPSSCPYGRAYPLD